MTSSASASCGMAGAATKLVASITPRPVSASLSISPIFIFVGMVYGSFCSPSRGPTSTMVTRSAMVSEQLDGNGRGFAATYAQAGHAAPAAPLFKRVNESDQNARAAGAQRVAQRTGAAVDVDLVMRQVQFLHGGHGNGGKSLVDFIKIDVSRLPASLFKHLFHGAHRRGRKPFRLDRKSTRLNSSHV